MSDLEHQLAALRHELRFRHDQIEGLRSSNAELAGTLKNRTEERDALRDSLKLTEEALGRAKRAHEAEIDAHEHTRAQRDEAESRAQQREHSVRVWEGLTNTYVREAVMGGQADRQHLMEYNHGTYPVGTRVKGRQIISRQMVVGYVVLQNRMEPPGTLGVRPEGGGSPILLDADTVRRIFRYNDPEPPSDVTIVREENSTSSMQFIIRKPSGSWDWSYSPDETNVEYSVPSRWVDAAAHSCTPNLIEHLEGDDG